jgi:hypothetical protein
MPSFSPGGISDELFSMRFSGTVCMWILLEYGLLLFNWNGTFYWESIDEQ